MHGPLARLPAEVVGLSPAVVKSPGWWGSVPTPDTIPTSDCSRGRTAWCGVQEFSQAGGRNTDVKRKELCSVSMVLKMRRQMQRKRHYLTWGWKCERSPEGLTLCVGEEGSPPRGLWAHGTLLLVWPC